MAIKLCATYKVTYLLIVTITCLPGPFLVCIFLELSKVKQENERGGGGEQMHMYVFFLLLLFSFFFLSPSIFLV